MKTRHILILLVVFGLCSAGKHDIYSRHSVHGIQIRDESDSRLLHELELSLDLDIWQYGWPEQRDALIMVPPENKNAIFEVLDRNGLSHYLHLADVAKGLEEHDVEISEWKRSRQNRQIFQGYPRYEEVNSYLESIASRYPNLVTLVNAGPSFEGRDIKYLKISTTNFTDTSKPIYFMDAMIHAREWVTTPVALYSIFRLVENLRTEDRDLLNEIDWIIMPLVNPDGYEYSHTDDRLWRKTRSIDLNVSETCVGVDGNRNFDIFFNTYGVSANPCALTWPGPVPFSEPELGYVRDVLHEFVDRIQIFMDIHSFGNYVLFGYGNYTFAPNVAQLHQVGAAMGAAMDVLKLPEVGYYLVGHCSTVLYPASGSAPDYGTSIGVPFSYTLELPGYSYDFRVPPHYMDQINEETWQGIAVTARLSRVYYRSRYSTTPTTTTATPTTITNTPTTITTTTTTTSTTATLN